MELPREIKEAVVYTARHWPRQLNSETLLQELNALAQRVYTLMLAENGKADAKEE